MSKGKYNGLSLQMRTICLLTVLSVFFIGCREKNSNEQSKQYNSDEQPEQYVDDECHVVYANSVKGHHEQDTITGNFTGLGIDTLYVVSEHIETESDSIYFDPYSWTYYAKSNNPQLPTIELYGYRDAPPSLVYEGDVDRDGKDEWGYLHTGA